MDGSEPRIVLSTVGSLGDLHPFIALARSLQALGYEAILATFGSYRGRIEAEGLGFHEVRPDWPEILGGLGIELPELVRRVSTDESFLIRKVIVPYLRPHYEDMLAATERADMVVTHPLAVAGQLAAERRGLPRINVALAPIYLLSAYDPPHGPRYPLAVDPKSFWAVEYNRAILGLARTAAGLLVHPVRRLRRQIGLPPAADEPFFTGARTARATVALYSPLLGQSQPDHPPNCEIVGFTFHDSDGAGRELEPELEAFLAAGPPPLVFTLGSFAVHGPRDFYSASRAAARALGQRAVILSTAEDRDRAEPSPDLITCAYVPHSLLFPRAAAVIHHGGVGTTGQALRAGKPQLVVPFLGDQPDNGARIQALGVGRVLESRRYDPERAASELRLLLESPRYGRRAAEVGRIVSREDGAARGAELIDRQVRLGAGAGRAA